MVGEGQRPLKGDRPLGSGDPDMLGFRELAERIATSLVDHASDGGLVVGLEGAWGSGKSSLLHLIADELGQLPTVRRPTVINFRPWLIGQRDALIASLFRELSNQIDRVALEGGDASRISVAKAKETGEALRRFVGGLSKAGEFVEFAGDASGFGPIKLIGKGLGAIDGWVNGKPVSPALADLKDQLAQSLRELGHRFIITIDDVDRLEPSEILEIIRLVRSVVDLPNIIYLLCYDSEILAHSIKKAAGVEDGRSYLEKIIQLSVMVPKPEPLQLRQWFSDELHLIALAKDDDERSRLQKVIDHEGGQQLRTPRAVVRALDAMRFFWPPLRDAKADLSDLVWVQLIKDGNPKLYRWIEEYCAAAATISLGTGEVGDVEKAARLDALIAAASPNHFNDLTYRYSFSEPLPGVSVVHDKDGRLFELFTPVRDPDRDAAIRRSRLSSPEHYRLYFALKQPSHALGQVRSTELMDNAEHNSKELGAAILSLHGESAGGSLSRADLWLDRIKGGGYAGLTPNQCKNLLIALSQVMDLAYHQRPFDQFWVNSIWDRAEDLVPLLLSRFDAGERAAVVETMFSDGSAIGWLTSLFRREIFAHGLFGERKSSESEWLFSEVEFNSIVKIMTDRYARMGGDEILNSPKPTDILFAWNQTGDIQGPRRKIETLISSDEGLVQTLERLTSPVLSSERGRYEVLREENLKHIMDYGTVMHRIYSLKSDQELGQRAERLATAFEDGQS